MIGSKHLLILVGLGALLGCDAFVQKQRVISLSRCSAKGRDGADDADEGGLFQGISNSFGNFFEELDNFVDDAMSRRLGGGAAFYGKRKSNFYGKDDKNKKQDTKMADPTEDYQGPTSSGLFQWMQDEDGQMRPVTRGKNKNIERDPTFWDRYYEKKDREEQ